MLKSENQNEELSANDNVVSDSLNQADPPLMQENRLGKSQKIAVAVLAFFAFLVFVFWLSQFKKNINGPFQYGSGNQDSNQTQLVDTTVNEEEISKGKDTDGDGLNDWDELNIYKTSPYLEDGDSDGFSDGEEIKNDKDPNCPVGRDCGAQDPLIIPENEPTETPAAPIPSQTVEDSTVAPSEQSAQSILSGQGDAKALRELLISSGMDKTMLDAISDEELMKFYQETLTNDQ